MTTVAFAVALTLAVYLFWGGVGKIRSGWRFTAIVRSWQVFPEILIQPFGAALPRLELLTSFLVIVALRVSGLRTYAMLAMIALFGALLCGQIVVAARSAGASCGCSGSSSQKIGLVSFTKVGACLGGASFCLFIWAIR